AAIEIVFIAQEILVGNADYPTEAIGRNTRRFRQLGMGYTNLGALLMALGLPYDSDGGARLGRCGPGADVGPRLCDLGQARRPHGAIRRIPREPRAHASGARNAP
ncbi:MAG TPA: hypothetical protein PLP95_11020, partial [Microthrixaceae bacterium]|nr:hypothetical protein [Microthrixaceae bacterium]